MYCKEVIWQRIHEKIRGKSVCSKIHENVSPHFQSQRQTVTVLKIGFFVPCLVETHSPWATLCQNRSYPFARVDLNPITESTLSPSQELWIWPPKKTRHIPLFNNVSMVFAVGAE